MQMGRLTREVGLVQISSSNSRPVAVASIEGGPKKAGPQTHDHTSV